MDLRSTNATSTPHIKCSDCGSDVPLHLIAEHVCSEVTTTSLTNTYSRENPQTASELAPQQVFVERQRPSVPRINPYASNDVGVYGELTPASSGSESAAASPISPGRTPPAFPPKRKASIPIRRPPSPELLSQDCAFPPFPSTKSKREGTKKSRGRTKTPDASRPKLREHDRLRSASVGTQRSKLRHEISDSSRPSTASSSRSTSRQGSFDTVPPLPRLQQSSPQHDSDRNRDLSYQTFSNLQHAKADSSFPATDIQGGEDNFTEFYKPEDTSESVTPAISPMQDSQTSIMSSSPQPREPSYRAKRPPPIVNLPSSNLDEPTIPKSEISPGVAPPPVTPTNSLARTLTNLFSRKRSQSNSNRKGGLKSPATDGPRFLALSPEPNPQDVPQPPQSLHSSLSTEMVITPPIHDLQAGPESSVDVTTATHNIPEPLQAQITISEEAINEPVETSTITDHDYSRDTLQMEQDFENRLAAMRGGAPTLSVIGENREDIKRASIDSASSYGSIGFSHSSTSSTSFPRFEAHSHGSSISTARTMSSSEDAFLANSHKFKSMTSDPPPDSPTDPYLQHGRLKAVPETAFPADPEEDDLEAHLQNSRLSTVHEVLSSPEEERSEPILGPPQNNTNSLVSNSDKVDLRKTPSPVPVTSSVPDSEQNRLEPPQRPSARRPSTPGTVRGICRGCSQRILSGQKSVSSKDGRLTGKYHKECFVCITCKQPFATFDFYVHNDYPYCAHHYHVLNETLCEGCGKGVEGQYLETSTVSGNGTKKFHPQCLQCATCKIRLQDEYFELGSRVYCEKDAFRLIQGIRSPYGTAPTRPSPLNREYISSSGPGQGLAAGRFPERRLTRLMTTH